MRVIRSPENSNVSKWFLRNVCIYVCVVIAQSCLTFWDPMDYSSPGSSVHEILQARILEWVAMPFSRGSSPPGDQTWRPLSGRWTLTLSHLGSSYGRTLQSKFIELYLHLIRAHITICKLYLQKFFKEILKRGEFFHRHYSRKGRHTVEDKELARARDFQGLILFTKSLSTLTFHTLRSCSPSSDMECRAGRSRTAHRTTTNIWRKGSVFSSQPTEPKTDHLT